MFIGILDTFRPIDINLSVDKALQSRVDSKFVINVSLLPMILSEVIKDYQCQTINGLRISTYESTYYDTADLQSFHFTRIKKPNRFKVRRRHYHNGNLTFLEIKKKVKGYKTIKNRIEVGQKIDDIHSREFLKMNDIEVNNLHSVINIFYERFTLVSNHNNERVTVDTKLTYDKDGIKKTLDNVAIIEIKQDKLSNHSKVYQVLTTLGIKKMSISKYCIGIGLLDNTQNTRGYVKKLNKVKEINQS
jgi:hypothetical protein